VFTVFHLTIPWSYECMMFTVFHLPIPWSYECMMFNIFHLPIPWSDWCTMFNIFHQYCCPFHGRYNRLIHMFSHVFTCVHLFPLVSTCFHLRSFRFTCCLHLLSSLVFLHLLSSLGLFYLFQPTNIWRTKNLGKWKTNPNGNAPSSEQSWRPVITLPMCECHPWPILLSFLPWLSDFLSILTGFLQCYSVLSSNVGKITLFKRQRDSPFSTFPLKNKNKLKGCPLFARRPPKKCLPNWWHRRKRCARWRRALTI
jgi:hypothetical protein